VLSVAWSPNGRHLATAGNEGTARIWDLSTGTGLRALAGSAVLGAQSPV
jgi:WD40 repeat protein